MDRVSFLESLKRVTPALGRGDLLPALAHLWFDGRDVSAFDDNISISAPCETPFEGGIDGVMLTRFTERAFGDEVEVKIDKQAAVFNATRSDVKFAILDLEHRQFEMPSRNKKAVLQLNKKHLHTQLKFCMQSLGHDVQSPEWCGVTMEVIGDELHVFSGYSQVLARAVIPMETKPTKFKRIILHEKFCQQILAYPKADLEVSDSHALLCDAETGVTVFGRSIGSSTMKLDEMVENALGRAKKFVKMPAIHGMLERASIFEGDHLNMELSVVQEGKESRLRMVSASGEARLVDYSTPLKGTHPTVSVQTNAKHLISGADITDAEIAIGQEDIVIRGGDATLVVSVAEPTK